MHYIPNLVDAKAIIELSKDFHAESQYSKFPFNVGNVVNIIKNSVSVPDKFLTAYDKNESGEITGFVMGYIGEPFHSHVKTAFDFAVYIRPEFRGGRLYLKLIKALEDWAEEYDCDAVQISHNSGINMEKAPSLFSRLSYKQNGFIFSKDLK